tara:strand:+ start:1280 stop:1618 length:339 start_codon:yes stop_codon:yes gene_type:complete
MSPDICSISLPNANPDLIASNALEATPTAKDIVIGSIVVLHYLKRGAKVAIAKETVDVPITEETIVHVNLSHFWECFSNIDFISLISTLVAPHCSAQSFSWSANLPSALTAN